MTPFISEFFGTFILILLGLGTNANVALNKTYGHNSGWIVIGLGWGLSVFAAVAVAGPYSGAHINPAVTMGLATAGLFAWSEVPLFLLAQGLGGLAGATMVWVVFKEHFASTEDKGTKLGVFSTGPAIKNYPINFICEMTGTFVLMFVILYFTEPQLNPNLVTNSVVGLGSVGALPVALLVTVIGLSLGGTTGYAINPARDLMPRIMHAILPIPGKGGSNWKYSWIPVFGPVTGAVIASFIYLVAGN